MLMPTKTIKIKCSAAQQLPLDAILEFQGGLKKLSKANLEKLKKNILLNGFIAPIFVWDDKGDYRILDGHQRLAALISLRENGYDIPLVPVDVIHAGSEAEARQMLLSITSQYGEFDLDELTEWVNDIDKDIKDLLRFTDQEIKIGSGEPEIETEGDDEITEDVKPVSKLGDLWELGRHRVLCGDSTDAEQVARLMDGKKADMVFTDPPYGMNLDTDWSSAKSSLKFADEKKALGGKKHKKVIGDNDDFSPNLIKTIFDNFGYCKEIFLFGADYYSDLLINKNDGSWIVWDKRLDESADKMYGSCFELCWSKKKHKRMIARIKWAGIFGTEKEFDHKRHHPTQKPINLVKWFFDYYSLKKCLFVADLYLGSGSTLIAAEKTNRICYGMELDEHYTDVIVKRYIAWMQKNNREIKIKLNGKPFDHNKL